MSRNARQLDRNDLVLCAGTAIDADFSQLIAAARAGGFTAISLYPALYSQARSSGLSDAAMRQLLADNGLCIAELDPLLNWVPGYEFPTDAGMGVVSEETFYRIADAIGARSLNVVWAMDTVLPEQMLVDAFAGLCERAAQYQLLAHIEFLPWAQVDTVETALRIVQQADQPNAGILFDSWHHFRGPLSNAALFDIPGRAITAIQLNDAPKQASDNLIQETMTQRLLPGEGAIDLRGIIRQLDHNGCNAPIGIEVFSEKLRGMTPEDIGRAAGHSVRELLRQARV